MKHYTALNENELSLIVGGLEEEEVYIGLRVQWRGLKGTVSHKTQGDWFVRMDDRTILICNALCLEAA